MFLMITIPICCISRYDFPEHVGDYTLCTRLGFADGLTTQGRYFRITKDPWLCISAAMTNMVFEGSGYIILQGRSDRPRHPHG